MFDRDVTGVYISDMVSDVIANAKAGDLLVTAQAHSNVIAAANLIDVCAIVITQGKALGRRRGEDGGEGRDRGIHDGPEPVADGHQAVRSRHSLEGRPRATRGEGMLLAEIVDAPRLRRSCWPSTWPAGPGSTAASPPTS